MRHQPLRRPRCRGDSVKSAVDATPPKFRGYVTESRAPRLPGERQANNAAPFRAPGGQLEAVRAEVDRPLRRERNKARQEASDEREHGRKREDELLDLVKATQRQLGDQTKPRSLWQRISGKG